jgi:hypothetical protein
MGDGDRTVVWCVATALAQILYYHQWPPVGFGHTSYIWNGDQSCGGTTSGRLLVANFSDPYDWSGSMDGITEICEEVGKSYHVDYGVCYSVGDTMPIYRLLPDNFAYQDSVQDNFRSDHSAEDWFAIIREELDNNRPIDYLIFNHMIACDGWMTTDLQNFYHMNYGWGGGNNAWYAIDNLYCGWAGCDPMLEHMYTRIEPDRSIMFYADAIAGPAPLEIGFTAGSDRSVDSWLWDFGDGDSAETQSPTHIYTEPGIYDVSLTIGHDDTATSRTRSDYIHVLADSVIIDSYIADPGETVEITIDGGNLIPLYKMILPIRYDGELGLTLDSISVSGCRTELCQNMAVLDMDSASSSVVVALTAWESGYSEYPYIPSGSGKILKLYFRVAPDAIGGQHTEVRIEDCLGYSMEYYGSIYGEEYIYGPITVSGLIGAAYLCGDANYDQEINVGDAVFLINYIFNSGPAPDPLCVGDANGDGDGNVGDAVYLIAYVFNGGPPPVEPCCR